MICVTCNTDLGHCACPERDHQLRTLAYDPQGFVAFKWCRVCDHHYARCFCPTPDFYVISRGVEIRNTPADLTRR